MPAYSPFRIEIRSPDRTQRRRFPVRQFVSAQWTRERFGGFGTFTLATAAPVKGGLASIRTGDQVEFWYRGTRRYRGIVQARRPSTEDLEKLTIEGAGVSAPLAKQLYAKDPTEGVYYAYPGGGRDASVCFGDIGKDFLLPATAPGGLPLVEVVQAAPIGTLITTLDGRKKLSGDILNDWVQQTGNLAAWGCDVDAYGRNRAYGRPITLLTAPADHVIPVPGDNVESASAEHQSADIVNCGLFVGDNPQYPQMLANGNFAQPTFYQEGDAGIITDGDFEQQSGWDMSASYKPSGGIEGDPFSGSWMVEADHPGEYLSRSGTYGGFVAGHNYTFGIRAKKEVAAQIADGSAYLQIKDAGGSVLQTFSLVLAPIGTAWDYFSQTQGMPAGAASWTVHAQADHVQGINGDQGGLLLDAIELFDADVAYQTNWQCTSTGGSINALSWLYQDTAYTGKYCVYLNVSAQDQDGHDIHLAPLGEAKVRVGVKQGLRLGLQYRSPVVQTLGLGLPKFGVQLLWYRSDGSYLSKNITWVNAQAANVAWQYAEVVAGAPQGATEVLVLITPRTNGEMCVDAISLRDSAAPAAEGVPVSQYVPEGPLTTFLRADDASLGLPAAAAGSIAANGTLAGIDQVGSLIRLPDLRAVGKASLSTTALELRRPDLTLLDDPRVFWPGESVRLAGVDGPSLAPTPLSIARVEESIDAGDTILRTALHLEKPQPDQTLTEKKLIQDELNKRLVGGSGGASAAGAGSGASGCGGGATTPVTLQTITESPNDPTTHDNVRTGPHVSDQEHTDLAATKSEVIAARTRTVKGVAYPTLEPRLDAMEVDIAAGSGTPVSPGTADGQTLRWNAVTGSYVADPLAVNNGTVTLTLTASSGDNTGLYVKNLGTGGTDFPIYALFSANAHSSIYVTNHGHPLGCITGYYTTASDGYRFLGADASVIFAGYQNGNCVVKGQFQAAGYNAGDGTPGYTGLSAAGDTMQGGIMTAKGNSAPLALSTTAPSAETAGAAASVGAAATAARADHVHAMPAAYPPTAHAASHGVGGADAVTPASIGATATASNLSDLGSAALARTNLGLGTAAVANLPAAGSNAAAGQIVRGDDTRLSAAGSGGTSPSRVMASVTTTSLVNYLVDSSEVITLAKTGLILQLSTTAAAWVRLYDSAAALAADASRAGPWSASYTRPVAGKGLILEAATAANALTIPFSPIASYANLDTTNGLPNTTYHCAIGNASGATQAITVTISHLPLEN